MSRSSGLVTGRPALTRPGRRPDRASRPTARCRGWRCPGGFLYLFALPSRGSRPVESSANLVLVERPGRPRRGGVLRHVLAHFVNEVFDFVLQEADSLLQFLDLLHPAVLLVVPRRAGGGWMFVGRVVRGRYATAVHDSGINPAQIVSRRNPVAFLKVYFTTAGPRGSV